MRVSAISTNHVTKNCKPRCNSEPQTPPETKPAFKSGVVTSPAVASLGVGAIFTLFMAGIAAFATALGISSERNSEPKDPMDPFSDDDDINTARHTMV